MSHTLEIVTFQLTDNISHKEYSQALKQVKEQFLSLQPGFISIQNAYNQENNTFLNIVTWGNLSQAKSAAQKAFEHPDCLNWFQMMNEKSITMNYFEQQ